MSLVDNGGLSAADIAAVTGNNNGFGFGGDGAWWLIVLFLFAFAGNGFGNGFGGNGGMVPWMMTSQNDTQRGFDQAAIMGGINGINASLANAEISRCNAQANILQTLNSNQAAMSTAMNSLAMGLQQCCCDNRAATADLKYTVATEACADRAAVESALRDVITANNASTQRILDQMCQDKIDSKNEQITALQNQLAMAQLAASQNLQTQQILAGQEAGVNAVERYLAPTPIPAYIVQNPACCNQGFYGGSCCGGVA